MPPPNSIQVCPPDNTGVLSSSTCGERQFRTLLSTNHSRICLLYLLVGDTFSSRPLQANNRLVDFYRDITTWAESFEFLNLKLSPYQHPSLFSNNRDLGATSSLGEYSSSLFLPFKTLRDPLATCPLFITAPTAKSAVRYALSS